MLWCNNDMNNLNDAATYMLKATVVMAYATCIYSYVCMCIYIQDSSQADMCRKFSVNIASTYE